MHESIEKQKGSLGKSQIDEMVKQTETRTPPEVKTNSANSCNFEVKKLHYRSVLETTMHVYRTEGMTAFLRGVWPRMTINVPSTALSWGTYEIMKGYLTKE